MATTYTLDQIGQAAAAAMVAQPLGRSGPTVGVALQTGAYGNTEALMDQVSALSVAVTTMAGQLTAMATQIAQLASAQGTTGNPSSEQPAAI